MSQAQFAHVLGLRRQATISDWESGERAPRMSAARMEELIARYTQSSATLFVLEPRSYAIGVLTSIEKDALSTLAKIGEARRVLGAATPAEGLRYAATEARAAMTVAESPPARAVGGSRRRGRQT